AGGSARPSPGRAGGGPAKRRPAAGGDSERSRPEAGPIDPGRGRAPPARHGRHGVRHHPDGGPLRGDGGRADVPRRAAVLAAPPLEGAGRVLREARVTSSRLWRPVFLLMAFPGTVSAAPPAPVTLDCRQGSASAA